MQKHFHLTFVKAEKYKDEEEYRLFNFYDRNIDEFSPNRKEYYDDNCLKEIILGKDFPLEKVKEVKSYIKGKSVYLYKVEENRGSLIRRLMKN